MSPKVGNETSLDLTSLVSLLSFPMSPKVGNETSLGLVSIASLLLVSKFPNAGKDASFDLLAAESRDRVDASDSFLPSSSPKVSKPKPSVSLPLFSSVFSAPVSNEGKLPKPPNESNPLVSLLSL